MYPSKELNAKILETAERLQIPLKPARVHSSDVFYAEDNMDDFRELYRKHQCECVEMESFALFHNAKLLGKNAACLLTISDSFVTHEELSSLARQESFEKMMKVGSGVLLIRKLFCPSQSVRKETEDTDRRFRPDRR